MINTITCKVANKKNVIEKLKVGNILETNRSIILNEMCKYFAEIGMTFANKIENSRKPVEDYVGEIRKNPLSIYLTPCCTTEIVNIIGNLKSKKSSGWDGISNKFLKEIKHVIAYPLSILFNKSLEEGIFPEIFKWADVIPLFKSGDTSETKNYRPISLLPTFSKVLEKLLYKRVYTFLDNTGQIYQSQYGFRSKHSREHAVQELVGKILKGIENKKYTAAIFLDLSKAFDSLEHHVLLTKLSCYGIRGVALKWFESYLSMRRMRVTGNYSETEDSTGSEYRRISYGVPQGSCLGPLLFLVFCNDLPLNLHLSKAILFADDTTIYKSHENLRYPQWSLHEELKQLADWFKANKLTLNLKKSCCMIFAPNKSLVQGFTLELDGVALPIVNCTKFLGVWLDSNLNWKKHVSTVLLKIKRNINLLKVSKNFLDPNCKIIIFHAHFMSHVNYCLSTWGNMIPNKLKGRVQKSLDKCTKLISNHPPTILSLDNMITLENCNFGYKLVNKLLPEEIVVCAMTDHKGRSLQKQHKYNTRHKIVPNLPIVKSSRYLNGIFCMGYKEYIVLSTELKNSRTLQGFARKCHTRLLNKV